MISTEWLWEGFHEKRSETLPYVNNDFLILTIWLSYLSFVGYFGPKIFKDRVKINLRPLMLIYDGLTFGSSGTALAAFAYILNFGLDCFTKCDVPRPPLVQETLVLIAYVFFLFRHFEMLIPIFMMLRKKPNQSPLKFALQNFITTYLLAVAVRHYVQNLAVFFALSEGLKLCLRSAYYALCAPGQMFDHHRWIKNIIIKINLACQITIILQLLIASMRGCKYPSILLIIAGVFTIIDFVFTLKSLIESPKTQQNCNNNKLK
ncbi:very long chain fatty acid elongase 7-like [Brevipalpus obovatus]|uniref:very long chain fatty acid elongase 7-like n=1 Tax=Brevipalpus obovatus TaxID=246614 RepID=UPI003D9F3678